MTKQEFTERTGYQPTAQEFETINNIYMATDDDKDTFCANWVKINIRLVRWQKKARTNIEQAWSKMREEYYDLRDIIKWKCSLACSNGDWLEIEHLEERMGNLKQHLDFMTAL